MMKSQAEINRRYRSTDALVLKMKPFKAAVCSVDR